ncbi:M16 family metallopeptidase [Leptolyngbya sp. 7M]|uniref:M16 family metallopeptidase n=1 Tax=Leptolyngbya sp. 7M TaxID=2812896 RepID=UPI001B8D1C63|nr:pitrilysin family protein [Leptolyngbya sp. 7M]QYO64204.1 insulinase family protein [Leptolyngbya sp. 7M]
MTIQQTIEHSLQDRTIHRAVLHNGMVVLAAANPAADIVAARLYVRAGGRYEPLHQAGLSHLLSSVITKGTERLSSQQIAEHVESVGASLGADAAADYCLMSLKTVSSDFAEMLELLAELVRSPSFPEDEVELERKLTLQGIRSMQEQPFAVANSQLRQALYGQHPYAMSSLGTEETVAQIDFDEQLRPLRLTNEHGQVDSGGDYNRLNQFIQHIIQHDKLSSTTAHIMRSKTSTGIRTSTHF